MLTFLGVPKSGREALLNPIWKAAMLAEVLALMKNETWIWHNFHMENILLGMLGFLSWKDMLMEL